MDSPERKYRALYELSKELLFREHEHFTRLEQKASALLSVFTVLVPASAFFTKWTVDNVVPPDDVLESLLLAAALGLVVSALLAWVRLLLVFRLADYRRIPLNQKLLTFFDQHDELDVYFGLAWGIADAYATNREVTADKVETLARGYRQILWTLTFVVAFAWLYVVWFWTR